MSGRGIIAEEPPQACQFCGIIDECRPYGPNDEQIASMLRDLGMNSLQQFIEQVVPSNIAMTSALADALPPAVSEEAALAELRELANQNIRNLVALHGTVFG